jgi:hypothetical protein
MLEGSVEARESGPVIMLAGEADVTCADQLRTIQAKTPTRPQPETSEQQQEPRRKPAPGRTGKA